MGEREWNRDPDPSLTLEELLDQNAPIEERLGHFPFFHMVHDRVWDELVEFLGIEHHRRPSHIVFKGVEFWRVMPIIPPDAIRDCWVVELPMINFEHSDLARISFFQDKRPIDDQGIYVE